MLCGDLQLHMRRGARTTEVGAFGVVASGACHHSLSLNSAVAALTTPGRVARPRPAALATTTGAERPQLFADRGGREHGLRRRRESVVQEGVVLGGGQTCEHVRTHRRRLPGADLGLPGPNLGHAQLLRAMRKGALRALARARTVAPFPAEGGLFEVRQVLKLLLSMRERTHCALDAPTPVEEGAQLGLAELRLEDRLIPASPVVTAQACVSRRGRRHKERWPKGGL
mmetsp:Transcript_13774/g.44580  ORF Transcript_13774/g.44580 Transcript_13774/m.44580 type:complete len:227 (-) Transcript_13774:191-871(-)